VGTNAAIRTNCYTIAAQLDSAFHLAVNENVLTTRELSTDEYRPAKVREIIRTSHIQLPLSAARTSRNRIVNHSHYPSTVGFERIGLTFKALNGPDVIKDSCA